MKKWTVAAFLIIVGVIGYNTVKQPATDKAITLQIQQNLASLPSQIHAIAQQTKSLMAKAETQYRQLRTPSGQTNSLTPTNGGTLLVEPQSGSSPYLNLIQQAKYQVEVNSYLLTDTGIVSALQADAARGVKVQVIVAGDPYHDTAAVTQERSAFAGSGVRFKTAPARFEAPYTFDHAKYLVVDPGHPDQAAILGSSNLTYSGLGGGNREFDWETTAPATVSALNTVFHADWTNAPAGSGPRQTLVLSPGSQPALLALINSAKSRLWIETEEMSYVPSVLAAIEAKARAGVNVQVILPSNLYSTDRQNAQALAAAGAKVVLLSQPYPHAKLIIADNQAFIGSENFSDPSLNNNREVGIMIGSTATQKAATVFQQDFATGTPL